MATAEDVQRALDACAEENGGAATSSTGADASLAETAGATGLSLLGAGSEAAPSRPLHVTGAPGNPPAAVVVDQLSAVPLVGSLDTSSSGLLTALKSPRGVGQSQPQRSPRRGAVTFEPSETRRSAAGFAGGGPIGNEPSVANFLATMPRRETFVLAAPPPGLVAALLASSSSTPGGGGNGGGVATGVPSTTAAAAATPSLDGNSSIAPSTVVVAAAPAVPAGFSSVTLPNGQTITTFPIMYKYGDDVRQDQLVIQIIDFMDILLKQNGLDLCLTPYRVIATSVNDGFVEVVPKVETFQNIWQNVPKYLCDHASADDAVGGANSLQRSLERFTKSCAGYCVITFILGIGDRHLENLLVTADGRLLHIDFGFILGNEPPLKGAFPPPMKFNREMMDTMGQDQFPKFQGYCSSAYNILRKHRHLIMSLWALMIDAGIPNISASTYAEDGSGGGANPVGGGGSGGTGSASRGAWAAISKVQERLRTDLSDAEATQYMLQVIQESVSSRFARWLDMIHERVSKK